MRDIYEVITIATETGHDAIARAAAQQLVDLQEELAALKAENAKLKAELGHAKQSLYDIALICNAELFDVESEPREKLTDAMQIIYDIQQITDQAEKRLS